MNSQLEQSFLFRFTLFISLFRIEVDSIASSTTQLMWFEKVTVFGRRAVINSVSLINLEIALTHFDSTFCKQCVFQFERFGAIDPLPSTIHSFGHRRKRNKKASPLNRPWHYFCMNLFYAIFSTICFILNSLSCDVILIIILLLYSILGFFFLTLFHSFCFI